jgi:hypothetical protein
LALLSRSPAFESDGAEFSPSFDLVDLLDRAGFSLDLSPAALSPAALSPAVLSPAAEVLLAAESSVFAAAALVLVARLGFAAASALVPVLSTAEVAAGEVVSVVTLRLRRTGLVSWISSMYVFALSLRQRLSRKIED